MRSAVRPTSKNIFTPSFHVFEVLFFLSLFLFPSFLGSVNLWSFSIGAVLLCGAFSFYWFRCVSSDDQVLRTQLDRWIAAYLVFFLFSLLLSKIRYFSFLELYKLSVVFCAFFATRYLCRERSQIYRLAQCFVFLGGLLSAIGLMQYVGGLPKGWWHRPYFLSSTYVNHNHFAGLLDLILPIAFGLVLAERNKSKKILFLFLNVLMGIALVFTLSRGAWISFCIAMVWMIGVLKKRRLISASLLPLIVVVILVLGAVLIFGTAPIQQRIGTIQRMTEEEALSMKLRWITWLGTLSMISRYFWFGSGPGTFGYLFLQFRPAGLTWMRPVYAHNDFLHFWAECGIFSFLAMTGLTVVFFRKGLQIIRIDDSRLRIGVGSGVMAGILGLLVHGLFDFNFHIPANWLLSAVAAGLLFSMDENEFYDSKVSWVLKILISLTLVAVLSVGFYFGKADYHFWEANKLLQEKERESALEAVEKSIHMNPWDAESHYLRGVLIDPTKNTRMAVNSFEKAMQLNPYEPIYDMAKTSALVPLLGKNSPEELVAMFEKAIQKDPNNQSLAFMVARETFGDPHARRFILRELTGKMLEQRKETLAGLVAFLEKKDLWWYHRKYHLKLLNLDPDAVKNQSSNELWNHPPEITFTLKDFSQTGNEPLTHDELFFRNGELSRKIIIHNSLTRIVLSAKGSMVRNVYPVLYVKIDGKIADEYYVDSKGYKNYYTDVKLEPGKHILSLEYVNDLSASRGWNKTEDRNVWIRRVELR